jgi:hypothetical protein
MTVHLRRGFAAAAGTERKRDVTVAAATMSSATCVGQSIPGRIIFGFRSEACSVTFCE